MSESKPDYSADMNEAQLRALAETKRQARLAMVTRELGAWLEQHGATLTVQCGFNQDGRHVSQIQVILKE